MIDTKLLRERPEDVIAIYRERLFDEDAVALAGQVTVLDRHEAAQANRLEHRRCRLSRWRIILNLPPHFLTNDKKEFRTVVGQ